MARLTFRSLLAAPLALALAFSGVAGPVQASGGGDLTPPVFDAFGGPPADQARFFAGQPGVLMANAPDARLFMAWRLLHGQAVGSEAGAGLSMPCCGYKPPPEDWSTVVYPYSEWSDARRLVLGDEADKYLWIRTDLDLGEGRSRVNCFDGAASAATATLKDRISRYGANDPNVKTWLERQDIVFASCSEKRDPLPALTGAPVWLAKDGAYQAAAQKLYLGDNLGAAQAFADIAADTASPWQRSGLYLTGRALLRDALERKTPVAEASARKVLEKLAASPAGTWSYREEAAPMLRTLDYYLHPKQRRDALKVRLEGATLRADAASDFRDYDTLTSKWSDRSEVFDWIAAYKSGPAEPLDWSEADKREWRPDALAKAYGRWSAGHDPAWLIATLSLADPGDAQTPELLAAARAIAPDSPAYLTVAWQMTRLEMGKAPAAALRARLDTILKRADLSASDRNLFLAERLQLATDVAEFARLAPLQRFCISKSVTACPRYAWLMAMDIDQRAEPQALTWAGQVLVDRMTLADRMSFAESPSLPATMRLDVTLTNFARAVQLQDNAAIDALSQKLAVRLPPMATDFRRIAATAPGPDKRFAELLVFAKIPGLRSSLTDYYVRPEGTSVAQYQGAWPDWLIATRPLPPSEAAPSWWGVNSADMTCESRCGGGAFPLNPPAFIAAGAAKADRERGFFVYARGQYGDEREGNTAKQDTPAGAVAAWEEVLAWAKAHPDDPRSPEALYWLIRVSRTGASHNSSGRRAFQLLHSRYPKSDWTKKSPYYFD